ncbi:MAG: SH3 domain-containing protein [Rubricella sp.]
MKRLILLALLLWVSPAGATPDYVLPTVFEVTGVSAGDVLNVRAGPGTDHAVIGRLAPDATGLEVIEIDATGRWARLNVEEGTGWASLAYLAPLAASPGGSGAQPLTCFGTEPFWTLRLSPDPLWSTPEGSREPLSSILLETGVFRDPRRAAIVDFGDERMTVTTHFEICSDGMSDRAYGLGASIVRETETGTSLLTGCCTVGR